MNIPLLFGPYGFPAVEYISQFTEFGANAFWFHGFNPDAFEACQKHQIAPCVEFKTFRADFEAHPELIPIGVDGLPIRYGELVQGVCLSQKAFLQETEENLLEGLRNYQPAGIWLDYLTYAGWFESPEPDLQDSCFCPDCIEEFCSSTGIDAATPAQILKAYQDEWISHKCQRIAGFTRHYASLIRSHLPGCVIGAYMCPWTPDEFIGAIKGVFAQDYDLMAPAIDVFTPLIYVNKSGRSNNWGQEFLIQMHNFVPQTRKVQLILDALDFPGSFEAVFESPVPSWGIQMFGGAKIFSDSKKAHVFRMGVDKIRNRIEVESDFP